MDLDQHDAGRVDALGEPAIEILGPVGLEDGFVGNQAGPTFDGDEDAGLAEQAGRGKANLDLTPTIVNEITLVGSRCGLFKPAIDSLASGVISVNYMIDSVFPLENFSEAFEHAKKAGVLKVFLKP